MEQCRWHWNYEQWNYEILFQLSSESIILEGLSECCHKTLCWNSRLDTAKYRDTTLEKNLKFSIEHVSAIVSYEYWRVNGIIYLTINSVSRRSNDTHTCIIVWNGSYTLTYPFIIHLLFTLLKLINQSVRYYWTTKGTNQSAFATFDSQ